MTSKDGCCTPISRPGRLCPAWICPKGHPISSPGWPPSAAASALCGLAGSSWGRPCSFPDWPAPLRWPRRERGYRQDTRRARLEARRDRSFAGYQPYHPLAPAEGVRASSRRPEQMGANLVASRHHLPSPTSSTHHVHPAPDLLRHRIASGWVALSVLLGGCGWLPQRPAQGGHLEATWSGPDQGKISAPASAEWCPDRRVLEIRAVQGDTGIAFALYPKDTLLAGAVPGGGSSPGREPAPGCGCGPPVVHPKCGQGLSGRHRDGFSGPFPVRRARRQCDGRRAFGDRYPTGDGPGDLSGAYHSSLARARLHRSTLTHGEHLLP